MLCERATMMQQLDTIRIVLNNQQILLKLILPGDKPTQNKRILRKPLPILAMQ
jgi:hypothetical protein